MIPREPAGTGAMPPTLAAPESRLWRDGGAFGTVSGTDRIQAGRRAGQWAECGTRACFGESL